MCSSGLALHKTWPCTLGKCGPWWKWEEARRGEWCYEKHREFSPRACRIKKIHMYLTAVILRSCRQAANSSAILSLGWFFFFLYLFETKTLHRGESPSLCQYWKPAELPLKVNHVHYGGLQKTGAFIFVCLFLSKTSWQPPQDPEWCMCPGLGLLAQERHGAVKGVRTA